MKTLLLSACSVLLLAAPAAAQPGHAHDPGMTHPAEPAPGAVLTEPGQSAFAALQEAVAVLEADPATDWARADVEALRQHLIDMDEVTLRARVRREDLPGGVRLHVTGEGRTREAIRRMLSGHAAAVNGRRGWTVAAAETADGAVLTVVSARAADAARIRALGLGGLLVDGAHHQQHHLAIARGLDPH